MTMNIEAPRARSGISRFTIYPLSDAEIERARVMWGCGKNTMQIRDYLRDERNARGDHNRVYEWQVYNALAR